jgi:DNA-binding XRE family transcriptional regulator/predicted RNase H-like HicB family nuclease
MRFRGCVYKNGRHWLAEIPSLAYMTQGRTKKEALAMICDLVESLVDQEGFIAEIHDAKGEYFELGSQDIKALVALLLQRKRELSGLSLAEAADRLGASSRNAYARYEQGKVAPTVEKLCQLLRAVNPDEDLVIA